MSSARTIEASILFAPQDEALRFLPEGPVACGGSRVSWVGIQHGAAAPHGSLNIVDIATGTNESFALAGRPGFASATRSPGVFLIGMERELGLFDTRARTWTVLCEGIDREVEGTIINDGRVFEEGVVFGTKDLKFAERKAGLYFWRYRDRRLFTLRSDQVCSNGKVLARRGERWLLLDIDSPTKTVVEYELDTESGRLSAPRVVLDFRAGDIFPDGMIGAPDGQSAIVSFYNPGDRPYGETKQFRLATGEVEVVWQTPDSPQATCPTLVSWNGRVHVIVTTAAEHMSPARRAKYPSAGCLFIAETPFTNSPPPVTLAF